jgi:hypothetical protein
MMRDWARFATGSKIAAVAIAALLGAAAVKMLSPEKELARGYGRALSDVADNWQSGSGVSALDPRHVVLSKSVPAASPAIGRVAVGDVVTIGGPAGTARRIVVTAVERLALETSPGLAFQIVTGRHEGANGATVRFIFADGPAEPVPGLPKSDKVL